MCVYIYIYIHIYIYNPETDMQAYLRERAAEKDSLKERGEEDLMYMCIYIYTYIYIYM